MNLYAIPNFACALACFGIGAFVLTKNYRSPVNITFTLLALSMFTWQLGTALLLISLTPEIAYRWSQFAYVGVTFIPATAYHFITTSVREEKVRRKAIWLSYSVAALIFLPLTQTRYLLEGVHHYTWGYWFKAGSLHSSFPVFFSVLMFMGLHLLYQGFQIETSGSERTRRRYLFIAIAISCIGSVDFLPDYGFPLYPFGYLPVFTCISILAYAIVKHQLMDINVVIRKSLVYSILVTGVTLVYLLSVLLVEKLSQGILGYQGLIATLVAAVTIAVGFIPFKNIAQGFIDRMFYKGSRAALAAENERLKQELVHSEKLKVVATLAAGLCHELRNPLQAIQTHAEYLPERRNDPQFLERCSELMRTEIGRVNELLKQLMDFARPKAPTLQPVEPQKILIQTHQVM